MTEIDQVATVPVWKRRLAAVTIAVLALAVAILTYALVTRSYRSDAAASAAGQAVSAEKSPSAESLHYRVGRLELGLLDGAAAEREALRSLAETMQAIQDNYYEEPGEAGLLEAMRKGLPAAMGSPWTYALSAEAYQDLLEANDGAYCGIGATVLQSAQQPDVFELLEISPGSPAEEVGLLPGDQILRVDGEASSAYADPSALAKAVKGPAGTSVELEIYRPSSERSQTFTVPRREVTNVEVETEKIGRVGLLRIREFTKALPEQFRLGIQELLAQETDALVFDLRNNPGGDAAAVRACLDELLDSGDLASVEGRMDGQPFRDVWRSKDGHLVPDEVPIAVLINENSASASELFAGCLRDRGRAVLVGKRSFGKGSGTIAYPLSGGAAVNITVFRYFLPAGACIEGEGLEPDLTVDLAPAAKQKLLSALKPEEDAQLTAAIHALMQKMEPKPAQIP